MSKFAKLYEDKAIGQILVKLDSSEEDDQEAEVRIYFEPQGLGVCSTSFHFSSWDDAEEAFDKVNQKLCVDIISEFIKLSGGLVN